MLNCFRIALCSALQAGLCWKACVLVPETVVHDGINYWLVVASAVYSAQVWPMVKHEPSPGAVTFGIKRFGIKRFGIERPSCSSVASS